MNRLERFIYKRGLFLLTGILLISFSFSFKSLPERLSAFLVGSIVCGIVAKDTYDDK